MKMTFTAFVAMCIAYDTDVLRTLAMEAQQYLTDGFDENDVRVMFLTDFRKQVPSTLAREAATRTICERNGQLCSSDFWR